MSDINPITPRSPELCALGQEAHAAELIISQPSEFDEAPGESEAADPYANYRTHLARLACLHVADTVAPYLRPSVEGGHGLTPRQVEDIIKITEIAVREFAFGVVKGEIDLEPNPDPVVIIDVTDDDSVPGIPKCIDEGRGIN